MSKKTLNLQISEFEQLAETHDSVSLMPCPCGASGGKVCGWVASYVAGRVVDNIINDNVAPPLMGGSIGGQSGPSQPGSDFGHINAEIEAATSSGGGGSK